MAKTYPNKFFDSSMQGAPQVTQDSAQGQVAQLLKAVLVDGFGALEPDSIVWDAETGWAKASFSTGHSYITDSIIACSGATQDGYNGEHRVMQVTTNDVWFELDTDQTEAASGESLEMKVAPAGWILTASDDANEIMIFTPANDVGNVSLRIDNSAFDGWTNSSTYARLCKVAMVEDVTDIDTYTLIYEHRWSATDNKSSGGWDLVADDRIFYYMMRYGAGQEWGGFVAGYIDSIRAGDRYHFIMNHLFSTDVSNSSQMEWDQSDSNNQYYAYFVRNNTTEDRQIARAYTQLEGTTGWKKRGMGSYGSDVLPLPNPVDNGFYLNTEPQMVQETSNAFRGYMPILIEPLANNLSLYRKTLKDLPAYPNKMFRMLKSVNDREANDTSVLCGFDISTVEV